MKERKQGMHRAKVFHARRSIPASRLCLAAALVFGASSLTTMVRADVLGSGPADWPMYNYDPAGTRYNSAETTLGTGNVGGLHTLWQYPTPAPVSATPVVVDGVVYAGDMAGIFYALRSSDGALLWSAQLAGSVTASALVTKTRVIVGDLSGNLYGLDPVTGAIKWSKRPDSHPLAAIFGSPTPIGEQVAVGIASNEESAASDPNYPCCSTRGSMVLLEPNSGTTIWQTFTVTDAERAAGASGSSIWSTPTYASDLGLIFATTGNNFSQPTNGTSDAIMAFNAQTGKIVWVNQRFPNDEWNFRFLPASPEHPDADFGDSAQVYTLANGRRVVGAGQKSGFYHLLDAKTGAVIWFNQYEVGGTLGGLFADSAVANGVAYANGVNWPAPGVGAPVAGDLYAIAGDGSLRWQFTTQYTSTLGSPDFGGVAVANGVVYFTSFGIPFAPANIPGALYALNAASGTQLARVSLGAGVSTSTSGPAVSRGRIYVGTGNAIAAGFGLGVGPGTITAMGL